MQFIQLRWKTFFVISSSFHFYYSESDAKERTIQVISDKIKVARSQSKAMNFQTSQSHFRFVGLVQPS